MLFDENCYWGIIEVDDPEYPLESPAASEGEGEDEDEYEDGEGWNGGSVDNQGETGPGTLDGGR